MDIKRVGEMLKSLGFDATDVDRAASSSDCTHQTDKQKEANERLKAELLKRLNGGN